MKRLDALLEELSAHERALALGPGHSVVAARLGQRGMVVDVANGDWPSVQLPRRYSLVIVEPPDEAHDAAAIVHCAAQHVAPGGEIVTMVADTADAADRFDLGEIERVEPEDLAARLRCPPARDVPRW